MIIIDNIDTYKDFINKYKSIKIGLVPTMGALHKGHISLIEKSKKEK